MKPTRLSFSPALPCVECKRETTQGLISPVSALAWQLLPLCAAHIEEPPASAEPVSPGILRCRINEQLAEIQQLQRRKHHMARAYARLRKHHAPIKAQRALRWRLNRAYETGAMEVLS